jgi:excisionase family DNA binding protein
MNETTKKTSNEELATKPILNLDEMAQLLNCSRNTIYRMRDEGILKATRPASMRAYLVERAELERLLAEGYGTSDATEPTVIRGERI